MDIKMNSKKYPKWTNIEIEILKNAYPNGGYKGCCDKLDRTYTAIISRAKQLGLKAYGVQGGQKRLIVSKIGNNKIIAICPRHGNTTHSHRTRCGLGRLRCNKCESEQFRKWSSRSSSKEKRRNTQRNRLQKPIYIYQNRLRSALHHRLNGQKGFTKHLPYSGEELCDHLEGIRRQQNNRCPMCKSDYDDVGYDIDHIVPTSSASNESELLALFGLENLSLLCPRCNRFVKRDKIPPGFVDNGY